MAGLPHDVALVDAGLGEVGDAAGAGFAAGCCAGACAPGAAGAAGAGA